MVTHEELNNVSGMNLVELFVRDPNLPFTALQRAEIDRISGLYPGEDEEFIRQLRAEWRFICHNPVEGDIYQLPGDRGFAVIPPGRYFGFMVIA